MLRRVARYGGGWLPNRVTPKQVEESRQTLNLLASKQGRDPQALTISVFGQPPHTTRSQVDAFLNAGAVRVSVWPTYCETEKEMGEQLERMAEALLR